MQLRTLLLAAAMAAASAVQAQQGIQLASGLTDFTAWSRFGSATAANTTPGNGFTYSDLILTSVSGVGGESGAGFAPTALTLDFNQAFSFNFNFFISGRDYPIGDPGLRGDGLTFTLSTATGVGTGGSGLGYEGLATSSVAFAIDTFHFDGEAVSPSVQILSGGNVTPLAATATGLGDSIRALDYQWRGTVSYTPSGLDDNAGTLVGLIEHLNLGSFSVQAAVDFGALGMSGQDIYYGFTAGNGLANDAHFVTSAAPIPEPATWALMLSGMAAVGWAARLRRT